jgi:phosphate-selective porin OprO/OprP
MKPAILRQRGSPKRVNGYPFFMYVPTMMANGMQNRVAPHFYWYGQFSVLAEWAYSERNLTNTATGIQALERVNGYYIDLSYFLTGERYTGDGLSGFSAIAPNRPFSLHNHQYGIGAWELGFQYAQLSLNKDVVAAGFADPLVNATQLNQLMLGINWYMNKYTKFSFDWLDARTNKAVPIGSNGSRTNHYDIFWTRVALMF